jgi:hypothetical protein
MSKGELDFMLNVLPDLYAHWCEYPHSLIARLYGVFKIKLPNVEPVILMLMANSLRYKEI